ncbi:hypothetical protein [Borrelia sp. RT5S]|uniref:hypothetical protein n=1 Tax=Borrelia sp. RT5S TaxID=2898581 RepID=UPI001E46B770|nr:hypothetical protein [Borrelia sp. RT5S]UGQ16815.1 hypothetical protein LSO06_05690 [Borrelia sp. RT5S]
MKKIILTTLLALFALACSHDYSKTTPATTTQVKGYLTEKHAVTGKEYTDAGINGVLNTLTNKDAFLKAMTLKIEAKDSAGEKKFDEGVKGLKLPASGVGSFNTTIEALKASATAPAAKADAKS